MTASLIFSLASEGEFIIFDTATGKIVKQMTLANKGLDTVIHPITYVNKLLFAGGKTMELWNVIEQEKIYEFTFKSDIECVV